MVWVLQCLHTPPPHAHEQTLALREKWRECSNAHQTTPQKPRWLVPTKLLIGLTIYGRHVADHVLKRNGTGSGWEPA